MASSCGTDADKGSLRSHYLAFRKRLPSSVRDAADEGIARRVMGMPEVADAPVVLSYVSFGSEVQTLGVIRSLLSSGRRVAVPRCNEAAHSMACVARVGGDGAGRAILSALVTAAREALTAAKADTRKAQDEAAELRGRLAAQRATDYGS